MPYSTHLVMISLAVVCAALAVICALSVYRNYRLRSELRRVTAESDRNLSALHRRNQLDSAKDEFISNVSHEIRTPLTSIYGTLALLSSGKVGKLDDTASHLLRIATTNTERMVRLINDVLELERAESGGGLPMEARRCVLGELVRRSVDTMAAMAGQAGVKLEIVAENDPLAPIAFRGDPDRIEQVLCNLLSNAIKFSPAGSAVRLLSSTDGSNFELRVEDSGRGVPTDKLESIFGRFHQVESGDRTRKGGSGLGLAICRSIVVQHGGTIQAERNDAYGSTRAGTTFVIRMPRLMPEEISRATIPTIGPMLVVSEPARRATGS
jgi:signal transduction histidine kinase